MTIESNYVHSHGASFIGFDTTRLLGFDLINHMHLSCPKRAASTATRCWPHPPKRSCGG